MKRLYVVVCVAVAMAVTLQAAPPPPTGLRIVQPDDSDGPYLPSVDYDFPRLTLTESGWTDFETIVGTGYEDANVVFVSSSEGNDSTGTVYGISDVSFDTAGMFQPAGSPLPYATITAAYEQIRDGYPDILLLKRGDEWSELFNSDGAGRLKSGRSFSQRHIIASYGAGDRPQLFESEIDARDASYSVVSGLGLYTNNWETADRAIRITGDLEHQLYEDLRIDQHEGSVVDGSTDAGVTNVAFRRCIFADHNAGNGTFYVSRMTGMLFEENVFYRPRRIDDSSSYGRHVYLSPAGGDTNNSLIGLILRRNIFNLGERESIDVRSGGMVENNLSLQNDITMVGGRGGSSDSIQTVQVTNNVYLEGTPNINGTNRLNLANIDGGLVSGNIWTDNTNLGSSANVIAITGSDTVRIARNIDISENIVYGYAGAGSARGLAIGSDLLEVESITVSSNEFQYVSGSSEFVRHEEWQADRFAGFAYSDNKYYSTSPETEWFEPGGTLSGWVAESGETGAEAIQIAYPDPNRNIRTYNLSLGGDASTEGFMIETLNQSRHNWRPAYTAAAVNNYIREGFGRDPVE